MKVSLNWLADYVDIDDLSGDEIAEKLTLATAEVEEVERHLFATSGVTVAKVVDIEPVPATDHSPLYVVTADLGSRRLQTVSAAPNIRVGMVSAYAQVGAELQTGIVGNVQFGGTASEGMLCSARELGWGDAHDGIVSLPGDLVPGTALSKLVPAADTVLEIDNKSITHRPDLWGHYGFAREVAAILRRPLRPLQLADVAKWDALPQFDLANDAPEQCAIFSCIALDCQAQPPSPITVQLRLSAVGVRSISSFVDATNYVALELGQPTHIYDRDRVPALRVGLNDQRSTFTTLDGIDRRIVESDLMIFSGETPVGIAGVMGGADSAVVAGTRRVVLESASFEAVGIRRTSVRLGIRTDASQRYEKTQPPHNATVGLQRLVQLLVDAGTEPEAASRMTVVGDAGPRTRIVHMAAGEISATAGMPIPAQTADEILHALGFETARTGDSLDVTVPPFRSEPDISISADIVEEVLRVFGYGSIEPDLPVGEWTATPVHLGVRRAHAARQALAFTHGFVETESYLWFDDRWLKEIGYDPGDTLRLRNPVAPEKARLRTTLLPNLLRAAHDNLANADSYALFEIGHVEIPGNDPNRRSSAPGHSEQQWLAGIDVIPAKSLSLQDHALKLKTVLEDLGISISGTALRTSAGNPDPRAPWESPDLWADVRAGDVTIGSFGLLAEPTLSLVTPSRQAAWFEIDLELIGNHRFLSVDYQPVPPFPASRQDFSILWPADRPFDELDGLLAGFVHPLVVRRRFDSVYRIDDSQASYLYRYWLQAPDRTLSGDDLRGFREELVAFLGRHGLSLR